MSESEQDVLVVLLEDGDRAVVLVALVAAVLAVVLVAIWLF
jgi:phosphopantothenate synthetase